MRHLEKVSKYRFFSYFIIPTFYIVIVNIFLHSTNLIQGFRNIWLLIMCQNVLLVACAAALALPLAKDRYKPVIQTFFLLILFLTVRFTIAPFDNAFLMVLVPFVLAIILKINPQPSHALTRLFIHLALVAVPIFILVTTKYLRFTASMCVLVSNSLAVFIMAIINLKNRTTQFDNNDLVRIFCSGFWFMGPVPLESSTRCEITPRNIYKGMFWIIFSTLGFIVHFLYLSPILLQNSPVAELLSGNIVQSLPAAGARWSHDILLIVFNGMLAYGILHMIGIPVESPFRKPWLSNDFLEYWKRMNLYRYRFLSLLYREFAGYKRGAVQFLTIILIFCISGLFHFDRSGNEQVLARWLLEGAIVALNLFIVQKIATNRIKLFIKTGGDLEPRHNKILRSLFFTLMVLLVFITHGILFDIER